MPCQLHPGFNSGILSVSSVRSQSLSGRAGWLAGWLARALSLALSGARYLTVYGLDSSQGALALCDHQNEPGSPAARTGHIHLLGSQT